MEEYGIKFFKIEDGVETEIEQDDLPDAYINGLYDMFRQEVASRERLKRVFSRMSGDVMKKL